MHQSLPHSLRVAVLLMLVWLIPNVSARAQERTDPNYSVKVSTYYLFGGGCAVSAAFGFWHRFYTLQPAANLSLNVLSRAKHLGNRNFWSNYWQMNVVMSPMLTVNLADSKRGMYEEINPFYLGNSGAVYSDYRSSITLGTSFMAMPKGTDKNIMTNRNRSQQLVYVQGRVGYGRITNVIINLYEDYLPITDNGSFQWLADNRDRFYTGGGNAQVRLSERLKYKLYYEVYTGSSYTDRFDFPDLVVDEDNTGKSSTRKHYAYQDPGQEQFNKGRTVHSLEYSVFPEPLSKPATGDNYAIPIRNRMNLQLFAGRQGAKPMWIQNRIHETIKINKLKDSESHKTFSSESKDREHLHYFRPFNKRSPFIIGAGLDHTFAPELP